MLSHKISGIVLAGTSLLSLGSPSRAWACYMQDDYWNGGQSCFSEPGDDASCCEQMTGGGSGGGGSSAQPAASCPAPVVFDPILIGSGGSTNPSGGATLVYEYVHATVTANCDSNGVRVSLTTTSYYTLDILTYTLSAPYVSYSTYGPFGTSSTTNVCTSPDHC